MCIYIYRDDAKEAGSYCLGFRVPQIRGTFKPFRGSLKKDDTIWGLILGFPIFANHHI